jgi:hypothetical protein
MQANRRPLSVRRRDRRVDSEGELYATPYWLRYAWATLLLLVLLEIANEALGLNGPSALYQLWFHDVVLVASSALVFYRASYEPRARSAWFAIGLAMASWTAGSILWGAVYGGNPAQAPYPTFADVLWLAWYPLMAIGIARLIKVRVPHFELHRWMDGLAVMLIVLAAGFALVVQPVAAHASQGALATIVDFSYPVLDVLLIGAVLGVYGILGWRPEKVWVMIGLGILATTIADAAYAVREAHGASDTSGFDFVWPLSALLIAYAAWVVAPESPVEQEEVTGLRAVALPLMAQALAAAIQIYALVGTVGDSERVVTLVVLAVSSVQIILTRPRPRVETPTSSEPAPAAGSDGPLAAEPASARHPP